MQEYKLSIVNNVKNIIVLKKKRSRDFIFTIKYITLFNEIY